MACGRVRRGNFRLPPADDPDVEQGETEKQREYEFSGRIIAACIEVHRHLGPGLLESAYEHCLTHELGLRGFHLERQIPIPLHYKGLALDCGYRLDLVVENRLVVEVKAVERLLPVHEAQVITYLKLLRLPVGLLINFHVPVLREGLRRLVNPTLDPSVPPFLPVFPSDPEMEQGGTEKPRGNGLGKSSPRARAWAGTSPPRKPNP